MRDDFRELRTEMREGQKELRAENVRAAARAEKRADQLDGRIDGWTNGSTVWAGGSMRLHAPVEERFDELAGPIRELTAKASKVRERGSGTRRLVWG